MKGSAPDGYWRLLCGNREEASLYGRMQEGLCADEKCIGFKLSDSECEQISSFLSSDNLEAARDYVDPKKDWIIVDAWSLSFYAELGDGKPPVSIKDAQYWGLDDDPIFSGLYRWLYDHFGLSKWVASPSSRWNKMRTREDEKRLVQKALDGGIESVENLLYDGKASQIRLIEELEHEKPLSYICNYPESFTLRMGRCVSRGCKMYRIPNCVRVFGEEHEFL